MRLLQIQAAREGGAGVLGDSKVPPNAHPEPESNAVAAKRLAAARSIVKLQAVFRGWSQRELESEVGLLCWLSCVGEEMAFFFCFFFSETRNPIAVLFCRRILRGEHATNSCLPSG